MEEEEEGEQKRIPQLNSTHNHLRISTARWKGDFTTTRNDD
jgi:hypothetical protein